MALWDHVKDFVKGETSFIAAAIGEEVDKRIEKAERTVEEATLKAIKTSVIYVLFLIGGLFTLVGVASLLQDVFPLADGVGFVIVGVFVLLLGRFAQLFR